MSARLLFAATSSNVKTGNVPTVWVGATIEEARASCEGCPFLLALRKQRAGDTLADDDIPCYSHGGTPVIGLTSIARKAKRQKSYRAYTPAAAMRGRSKRARMARFSALGDVARADRRQVEASFAATRAAGLQIVGYTHFWRTDGAWLSPFLLASVSGLAEVDEAARAGWKAATVMPHGTTGTLRTPEGRIVVECPAIAAERLGKPKYTCNDCASTKRGALCAASTQGPNVYFADHGPGTRKARRGLAVVQ